MPKNSPMSDIQNNEAVKSEPAVWFAMSATFGRELKARDYLESRSVECFVPMRHAMVADRRSGRTRRLVPAVSNLLFARTTRRRLQEVKTGAPYLQYHTIPVEGRNVPIVVPDGEMERFMAVCRTLREELVYLSPDEVDLRKDTPVRIEGGAFDGVEGSFLKVRKRRGRKVVVIVRGVAAVMITEVSDGYIKVLDR